MNVLKSLICDVDDLNMKEIFCQSYAFFSVMCRLDFVIFHLNLSWHSMCEESWSKEERFMMLGLKTIFAKFMEYLRSL